MKWHFNIIELLKRVVNKFKKKFIFFLIVIISFIIFIFESWYIFNNWNKIDLLLFDFIQFVIGGIVLAMISLAIGKIYQNRDQKKAQLPWILFLLLLLLGISLYITQKTKLQNQSRNYDFISVISFEKKTKQMLNSEELCGFNPEIVNTYKFFNEKFSKESFESLQEDEIYIFYNVLLQFSILKTLAREYSNGWLYNYSNFEAPYVNFTFKEPIENQDSKANYLDLKYFNNQNYTHYFDNSSEPSYIFVPLGTKSIFSLNPEKGPDSPKSNIVLEKKGWFRINIEISKAIPVLTKTNANDAEKVSRVVNLIYYRIKFSSDFNKFKIGSKEMESYVSWAKHIEDVLNRFNTIDFMKKQKCNI